MNESGKNSLRETGLVVMASGAARRFGANKLLWPIGDKPMIKRALEAIPSGYRVFVVTKYGAVRKIASDMGFDSVFNPFDDVSDTIRLGVNAVWEYDNALLMVGDQPWIRAETLETMRVEGLNNPECIIRPAYSGNPGNPVMFPKSLYGELSSLQPGQSGKAVIARHMDLVRLVSARKEELIDVDSLSDIK